MTAMNPPGAARFDVIRRTASRALAVFGGAALLLSASPGAQAATRSATSTTPSQWVMGYYVGYLEGQLPPEKIAFADLTHIIMSPLKANADGTLATDFDYDTVKGPALAKDIANRAHAAGKKAILMLGGDDDSPLVAQAVSGHMAVFVQNLVSTMNTLGYDGLDLDWENNINWAQFQSFVAALRKAAPNAILTLPGGALNANFGGGVDPHLPAIAKMLDRLNIQSYYPATAYSGAGWETWFTSPLNGEKPSTPVSIVSTFAQYVAAGIPKEKLGMGIAFYAMCYTGGITGPNQSTGDGSKVTIQGGDNNFMLSNLFGLNGEFNQAYQHWSAPTSEPYLSLPTADSYGCRYVSYENEQSIAAKGAYSRANGYGGIMIWNINQGYVASHPNPNFLMDALYKSFVDPDAAPTVAVSILQGGTWVKTGASEQLAALVTGTSNNAVDWSVSTANCGKITAAGVYTAPATQKSCTVTATSQADPAKKASATVTVSNAVWTPKFSISRSGTWWVPIIVEDRSVTAMSIYLDPTTGSLATPGMTATPLGINSIQYGTNYPIFVANLGFPLAGGKYLFSVRSKTNRYAQVTLTVPACKNPNSNGICQ